MRKALAIIVGLVLALACADSVTEPGADPPAPAFSKGAVVHHDFEDACALIDGDGHWFPGDWSLPCGLEVATFSKNMNASISIHASGVPNPTGKTVHWGPYNPGQDWADSYLPDITEPPYPCFLFGTEYTEGPPLYTLHWKAWVTPSGEATLSCQYSKKWEFQWP
jgi:hypothetical protein